MIDILLKKRESLWMTLESDLTDGWMDGCTYESVECGRKSSSPRRYRTPRGKSVSETTCHGKCMKEIQSVMQKTIHATLGIAILISSCEQIPAIDIIQIVCMSIYTRRLEMLVELSNLPPLPELVHYAGRPGDWVTVSHGDVAPYQSHDLIFIPVCVEDVTGYYCVQMHKVFSGGRMLSPTGTSGCVQSQWPLRVMSFCCM